MCFYSMPKSTSTKIRLKRLSYKNPFKKTKKISGTSLSTSFSAYIFLKKVSYVIFFELTKFHCLIAFIF